MKKIKLELTVEEFNAITNALADKPFKQVFRTIENIHRQAEEQAIKAEVEADNKKEEVKDE